jgi:tRNA A-37 threonylcarbamoyl transferase component Bud32
MLDNLYKKTGYYHDDAVPQNLGVDDGNLVVIDLGPNQTKTFNARKALDNIHDQRSKLGLPPIQEI